MSAETALYLDSSALVKLIVREPESRALRCYLRAPLRRVSSSLARVEVVRAVRPQGQATVARARQLLARTDLLRLDDALLDAAAQLEVPALRSLDAIHLASARALAEDLSELVTYDLRLAEAAQVIGLRVASPR